MKANSAEAVEIPGGLIEGLRTFPVRREVEHCGQVFAVSPFEFYAACPQCGTRIKVRSCSGVLEIEDVFDAVFEWLRRPGAQELMRRRQQVMAEDEDEG
jgi:hypothetical protein